MLTAQASEISILAWPSTEQSQPASLGLMFPAFCCQNHLCKLWSDGSKVSHSFTWDSLSLQLMCRMSAKLGLCSNLRHFINGIKINLKSNADIGVCYTYRLDVEGLMHRLHWVTVAELWGRRAGGSIIQHQGPEESAISHMSVTIQRNKINNNKKQNVLLLIKLAGDHHYNTA